MYQKFNTKNANGTPNANFGDDASWGYKFDPSLLVYQWDAFDPSSPNYGKPSPWVAAKNGPLAFYQNPMTFTNGFSIEKAIAAEILHLVMII